MGESLGRHRIYISPAMLADFRSCEDRLRARGTWAFDSSRRWIGRPLGNGSTLHPLSLRRAERYDRVLRVALGTDVETLVSGPQQVENARYHEETQEHHQETPVHVIAHEWPNRITAVPANVGWSWSWSWICQLDQLVEEAR